MFSLSRLLGWALRFFLFATKSLRKRVLSTKRQQRMSVQLRSFLHSLAGENANAAGGPTTLPAVASDAPLEEIDFGLALSELAERWRRQQASSTDLRGAALLKHGD